MPTLRHLTVDDYDAIIRLWKQAGLQSIRLQGRDSHDVFAARLASRQKAIDLEDDGQLSVLFWLHRIHASGTATTSRGLSAFSTAARESKLLCS
jgi:hypothetical protein